MTQTSPQLEGSDRARFPRRLWICPEPEPDLESTQGLSDSVSIS